MRNKTSAISIICIIIGVVAILIAEHSARRNAFVEQVRRESTGKYISAIKNGCELFMMDHGRYPSDAEGLDILLKPAGVSNQPGAYITGRDNAVLDATIPSLVILLIFLISWKSI